MRDDRTSQHATRAWPLGLVEACRVAALLLLLTAGARSARPQSKAGQAAAQAPQAAAVSALAGLSYAQASWPSLLGAAPADKHLVVLCYALVHANSGAQPFILEPRDSIRNADPPVACTDLGKTTLTMDQMLVVAIDARGVNVAPLKLLNLNVATQQGTPINPTPVRQSVSAAGPAQLGPPPSVPGAKPREGSVYYLAWLNRLAGDVIATLSINAIYSPPAPGAVRESNALYPAGSIVTTGNADGHYFLTQKGGVTGLAAPTWRFANPPTVRDGGVTWQLVGPAIPTGLPFQAWAAEKNFQIGDIVFSPTNLNYYVLASATGDGTTGRAFPQFPLSPVAVTTQEVPVAPAPVRDEQMQWQATGSRCSEDTVPRAWRADTGYAASAKVCDQVNGLEYVTRSGGTSGHMSPFSERQQDPVTWLDIGTVPPTGITIGQQPPDQTVNLLTLQLPQTHSLARFNLAAGVAYSAVRSRTFALPKTSRNTDDEVETSGSPTVEPVLFLTVYLRPVDAESRCGWHCLCSTSPGISLGLSLASPSSSFYAGLSFEVLRNVQVVLGLNWAKEASRPSNSITIPDTATSAVTVQRFSSGWFLGLTFNVSGFVQGILGGGGGKSSSGQ